MLQQCPQNVCHHWRLYICTLPSCGLYSVSTAHGFSALRKPQQLREGALLHPLRASHLTGYVAVSARQTHLLGARAYVKDIWDCLDIHNKSANWITKPQGASFHDIRISSLPQKIASFLGHPDNTFLFGIHCTPLMILNIFPHWLMFGIDLCRL